MSNEELAQAKILVIGVGGLSRDIWNSRTPRPVGCLPIWATGTIWTT